MVSISALVDSVILNVNGKLLQLCSVAIQSAFLHCHLTQ